MYYVYILKNGKGRIYTGQTINLLRRVRQHQEGVSFWTRRSKDWVLVYHETYASRADAIKREKELKSGKGRDELRKKGII